MPFSDKNSNEANLIELIAHINRTFSQQDHPTHDYVKQEGSIYKIELDYRYVEEIKGIVNQLMRSGHPLFLNPPFLTSMLYSPGLKFDINKLFELHDLDEDISPFENYAKIIDTIYGNLSPEAKQAFANQAINIDSTHAYKEGLVGVKESSSDNNPPPPPTEGPK